MRQRPFTSVFAIFLILSTSTSTALGYYNPKLGRFMQRDPVGPVNAAQITPLVNRGAAFEPVYAVPSPHQDYREGLSLYEYVRSSPAGSVDPSGQFSYPDIKSAAGLAASLYGMYDTVTTLKGAFARFAADLSWRNLALTLAVEAAATCVGGKALDKLVDFAAPLLRGAADKLARGLRRKVDKVARDASDKVRRAVALDANVIVRALDAGEVAVVDRALAGRTPIVSITAAKEYLRKGDANVLREFLAARGGRIGKAPSETLVGDLQSQAHIIGRALHLADARVVGSAVVESVPLLTKDAQVHRFLRAVGIPVEYLP